MATSSLEVAQPSQRSEGILYWSNAYKASEILLALAEFGILSRLDRGDGEGMDVLAQAEPLAPDRLKWCLDYLAELGVVTREGERYWSSGAAAVEPWLRLESYLRRRMLSPGHIRAWLQGGRVPDPLEGDPPADFLELLLAAIESWCETAALQIWKQARLMNRRSLLDLGGAAGSHALIFCRLRPDFRVTVGDRAIWQPWFQQRREAAGLDSTRLNFRAVNLAAPESWIGLARRHDAVLLSNTLHFMAPEARERLATALLEHVPPRTGVVLHDLFVQPRLGSPGLFMSLDWALLGADFSLTIEDFAQWLQGLGFRIVRCKQLPSLPTGIIVAETP